MKVLRIFIKRAMAFLIDVHIFAIYFMACQHFFPEVFKNIGTIGYLILFIPWFCRDIIFINASIGKKIFGLTILDDKWNRPDVWVTVKRSVIRMSLGHIRFIEAIFSRGRLLTHLKWEKEFLKTVVVERKVYKKLKNEAEDMQGDFSENMTQLYYQYLENKRR